MLALYPCKLRQCTNLKELHLYGLVSNHESGGSRLIHCMSQVLAYVGPPGVRTLVFFICGSSSDVIDGVIAQLGSVAAAISHNRIFEGLERVVVRVSNVFGAIVSEDVNTSIRNAFKGFGERDLLIVRGARLHGPTQVRSPFVALPLYVLLTTCSVKVARLNLQKRAVKIIYAVPLALGVFSNINGVRFQNLTRIARGC